MRENNEYRLCTNCIMDTSDSRIDFDESGVCDHCRNFYENIRPNWNTNADSEKEITREIEKIKVHGKSRSHDCLIGISGGIDSSYLTHMAVEKFGLNPLIFHVDGGWNTQQAVTNIERIVDYHSLDLHTEIINWKEMQDLQLSFFKAQVPTLDTPQDHAFFSALYDFAIENKFKYILTGANYSTECIREPLEWNYHTSDLTQTRDIHKKYGTRSLDTFPTTDILTFKIYYRYFLRLKVVKPLNYIPYKKQEAMDTLVEKYGWMPYAHKHHESRFTRFYEAYWLPKKFGFDKRRAHFSSLILTEQMTRTEALKRIEKPEYDEETIREDFQYIATKLDVSVSFLREIMRGENKSYRDYKNKMWLLKIGTAVLRAMGQERTNFR